MKTFPFLLLPIVFCLSNCNKSKDPDIQVLKTVAADKTQPDYIRKSVKVFDEFFNGETVSRADYVRASAELCATRTETTLVSLIAILHSLEARLPEKLPTEVDVDEANKKYGDAKNIDYKPEPIFIMAMIIRIIPIITYYDNVKGDSEVNGFFSRFVARHGASQAGKYWLGILRMEWKHAIGNREGNNGKWKSGREKMGLDTPWE